MGRYVYSLHDYHSIKRAVIDIDGVTVLSGVNGCGKSTLSKWLYYVVNGTNDFDKYVFADFVGRIRSIVHKLSFAVRDIERGGSDESSSFLQVAEFRLRRYVYDKNGFDGVDEVLALNEKVITRFCDALRKYLKGSPSPSASERLLNFLEISLDDYATADEAVEALSQKYMQEATDIVDEYRREKETRWKEYFFKLITREFKIDYKAPNNIQLEEDGVKLFRKNLVGGFYNLDRAIYVDTPMAVSEYGGRDNPFWDNLRSLMLRDRNGFEPDAPCKRILMRIRRLLNGRVEIEKNDFDQNEMHYVREDGLDIRLEDTATGFKSFSYIMRLLENGYINDKTLLMIDEPEAHLHPQWIVEFAHILVLLNKELGAKVMVASHNPNMVEAIQAIAKKLGVLENTHFYMAKEAENRFTYEYEDLGQDVEGVFKSFNVAYQKIEQYGSVDI